MEIFLGENFCFVGRRFYGAFACAHRICSVIVDTLLNVFLAIAVDNLANAHDLSDAEQADQNEEKLV